MCSTTTRLSAFGRWRPFCGRRQRARLSVLVLLATALTLGAAAAAQPRDREKASYELFVDRTAYEAGDTVELAAVVEIEEGWHIQSHQPTFEWLIPTEISYALPDGWPDVETTYPPHVLWQADFEEQPLAVYEGESIFRSTLVIPADLAASEVTVTASLRYQACDDKVCLPPLSAEQSVRLTIGSGGQPQNSTLFSNSGGNPKTAGASLLLMLLVALVGGLILNAMPCVLPVLSLKLFGLVKSAGQGRRQVSVSALVTASGILVSFWALAVLVLIARSLGQAVGWGIQFQNPTFVAFLAVVVVFFCLSLWGLFEVPLPSSLTRFAPAGAEGRLGDFVSGLFATLMATPCSAPFLGTAVGFALGQSTVTILAIFTAVGVGMALPYLSLALYPRAAEWLPRPGPWMDLLKGFLGFLLAGAAVWLLYVLSGQVSPERLAFLEASLLSIGLFAWLHSAASHRGGLRFLAITGIAAGSILTLVLAYGAREASERPSLISWRPFDRQQAESMAGEGRLVFVDVTAAWCATCKVNERRVLETEETAALFEEHQVIAMKADWTNRDDSIAAYLEEFGRYAIPFYVLYRPDDEPHVFGELLTRGSVRSVIEAAAGREYAVATGSASD